MKVKYKLTVDQFTHLLYYLQNSVFDGLTELQILNIRMFVNSALKKLIDLKLDQPYNTNKQKTFSVDVNQYCAIMSLIYNERKFVDPFILAIYTTLQAQNKPLLNLI